MRQDEDRAIRPGPRPPITVHYPGTHGDERKTFDRPFRIGRDEECDVRISSASVSRVHAEVVFENSSWWLIDLHSSNGTFHKGERVDRWQIKSDETLSFSKNGPEIRLTTVQDSGVISQRRRSVGRDAAEDGPGFGVFERTLQDDAGVDDHGRLERGASSDSDRPRSEDLSLEEYVEHYLSADSLQPAGEHTIMIRRAFQTVQKKQQKHHFATIAAVVGVALVIAIVSVVFIYRAEKQRERAEQQAVAVFNRIKELDIKIKRAALASGSAALLSDLGIEEEWQKLNNEYDQYVTEFGIRRRLNEKERSIYAMARVFNETEIEIPPGFVKEVNKTINDFWLKAGRGKFKDGIRRAEERGYTPRIVNTLRSYGLPPEFFYLALQESDFNVNAVGWETRWGFAKGMWQFIPATAERYGLRVGPLKDRKMPDPGDDRHNFELSTNAAARYLSEIYTTLAQASGLLVIASYNWGEHRVVSKLEQMPDPEAFEGIGRSPDERNYWRFYKEYGNRMPEETKDYVLKIFSAAVIGSNPQLFGFDFDDPLDKYR